MHKHHEIWTDRQYLLFVLRNIAVAIIGAMVLCGASLLEEQGDKTVNTVAGVGGAIVVAGLVWLFYAMRKKVQWLEETRKREGYCVTHCMEGEAD